jgi:hypothetical protein
LAVELGGRNPTHQLACGIYNDDRDPRYCLKESRIVRSADAAVRQGWLGRAGDPVRSNGRDLLYWSVDKPPDHFDTRLLTCALDAWLRYNPPLDVWIAEALDRLMVRIPHIIVADTMVPPLSRKRREAVDMPKWVTYAKGVDGAEVDDFDLNASSFDRAGRVCFVASISYPQTGRHLAAVRP